MASWTDRLRALFSRRTPPQGPQSSAGQAIPPKASATAQGSAGLPEAARAYAQHVHARWAHAAPSGSGPNIAAAVHLVRTLRSGGVTDGALWAEFSKSIASSPSIYLLAGAAFEEPGQLQTDARGSAAIASDRIRAAASAPGPDAQVPSAKPADLIPRLRSQGPDQLSSGARL